MKILHKLLIGYALIAGLTIVVGLVGMGSVQKIQNEYGVIMDEITPLNNALEELRHQGLHVVSSTLEFTFLVALREDARQSAPDVALLKKEMDMLNMALAECRRLMEHVPEKQGLLAEIEAVVQNLIRASLEFCDVSQKERVSAGRVLLAKSNFEQAELKFLRLVNIAHDRREFELAGNRKHVTEEIKNTRFWILFLSVITFGFALLIGLLISNSFSRRFRKLNAAFNEVQSGNLDTQLSTHTADEIGLLSSSFNQMVEELKRSKEKILGTSDFLDNIIDSVPDSLIVISTQGMIYRANPATSVLLGYTTDELEGMSFPLLFADPEQGHVINETLTGRGSLLEMEVSYRKKSGVAVPVLLTGSKMRVHGTSGHYLVCIAHNISRRKQAELEIKNLAYFDQLTGLANRSLFSDRLDQAIAHVEREGEVLALYFFDLDKFKDVNDTLGHEKGDLLLVHVARRLSAIVRKSDTLARLGGDEFVMLCMGLRSERDTALLADKMLELFRDPFDLQGSEVFISASIGIVLYPTDGTDGQTLIKHADLAMYAAKEMGRDAYKFFTDEMNWSAQERNRLEYGLRRALQADQMHLLFQPQVDLNTGRVVGVEALLRWEHPERGVISPENFIWVAEQCGLIRPLGLWVILTACRQMKQWKDAGHPSLRMAVNVSGYQIMHHDFISQIKNIIHETGVDSSLLELEMTESILMSESKETVSFLNRLKELNLRISVDDFGTGYSSLSYLKDFPIDRLKIDQSFIRGIAGDSSKAAIVRAIIALGHSLNLTVLAEGVELPEEAAYLKRNGCDEAQGYYFAKPSMGQDVAEFFSQNFSKQLAMETPEVDNPAE